MRRIFVLTLAVALATLLLPAQAAAQQTPKTLVSTYSALADAILALKQAEADFVTAVLQVHARRAEAAYTAGDYAAAAAEMALFASEGDNAVAGVRKRLVDGGHHHHAGANADRYDPGFVIVTKAAKRDALAAATAMREAHGAPAARAAWESFTRVVGQLLPAGE